MSVVDIAAGRRDPDTPQGEIEAALDRLFKEPMGELFEVDPVYLIGELRNGWTDILKDYVGDCLAGMPDAEAFHFDGRGGFHLAWGEPPRVHLELHYQAEDFRVLLRLESDGLRHHCRLREILPADGVSPRAAGAAFLARLNALLSDGR